MVTTITLSLGRVIPIQVVNRITGHKKYMTLERYLKITAKVNKKK